MEESYETFEEELGPPRADPPPQKPVRQIRRPEMYASRKVREEMAPPQPRAEPKTLPREPSLPRATTLPKSLPIQTPTQIETPWENVTLNRCLFVAITILVLTSGFQKLHETMRGQAPAEEDEEVVLIVRRPGALRHRGLPAEPETTLWDVMFWWLPDLDDEDEEDEEDEGYESFEGVKKAKSKRGALAPASKGHRNRPLPDKKLMKQREGKLKDRRAKKARDEEIKENTDKDKTEDPDEEADNGEDAEEEEEEEEEAAPMKSTKVVKKKERKKSQKG